MKFNPWLLLLVIPAWFVFDAIESDPDFDSPSKALENCQKELRTHLASRDLFWKDKRVISVTCFFEKNTGFRDRMSIEGRVMYVDRQSPGVDRAVIIASPRRFFACEYYAKACPQVTESWQ
jgi:hypothetical protein